MSQVPINYLAVLISAIASMILGFVWYGALFAKTWMRLGGITSEMMREMQTSAGKKQMYVGYSLQFAGSLVMAFVLAHALIFASTYLKVTGVFAGVMAGFWNWLGFIAPVTLGTVLWERKPWMLWIFNNAYHLINLILMGIILALWVYPI